MLSEKHELVLISLTECKVKAEHKAIIKKFASKIYIFKLQKFKIYMRLIMGIFSKLPFQTLYFFDKLIAKKIKEILNHENPDLIFNQLVRSTEYSKDVEKLKVLDYMDSFSDGMFKRSASSYFPLNLVYKFEYERLKKYEKEIFPHFNEHTIISEQDKLTFDPLIRDKITVLPNGVDVNFFKSTYPEKKVIIGFVGNMGYRPNVLTAQFIVNQILPELLKKHGDLKLLLAGARPDPRVLRLKSDKVMITGWMADIREAYEDTMIFVSPMFTGIGQQNKILEAMSMSIPVVTTSIVNNAIGAKDGIEILLADNKQKFIESILYLLENPNKRIEIGNNARDFVIKNYNWENLKIKLFDIFNNIV